MPLFLLNIHQSPGSTPAPLLILNLTDEKLARALTDACARWPRLYALTPLPVAPQTISLIFHLHDLAHELGFETHDLAEKVAIALEEQEQRQALLAKLTAGKKLTRKELAFLTAQLA